MVIFIFFVWYYILGVTAAASIGRLQNSTRDDIKSGRRLLGLQSKARRNLESYLESRQGDESKCTLDNLVIRREWRTLSKDEQRNYLDAVYCLQSKPSLFTHEDAPGSKNLFDSFTVVHMNLAHAIHNNFRFLAWHRYFVWVYEKTLREQCGYRGVHPYWEWGHDVHDLLRSPIFDGSPYSFGSNGAPLPNRTDTWKQYPPPPIEPTPENHLEFPAGLGGGCVTSGPFSDWTLNLGPIAVGTFRETGPLSQYKPHCLKRDLNPTIAQKYNSFNWTTWTIEESEDIMGFQARMTGDRGQGHGDYPLNLFGVHGGGHGFIGGMTGQAQDFFTSSQEPLFFLHHSQIDRMWSIWQWLDIDNRKDAIYGTLTWANTPPSRNGTLEDIIDAGPLAPSLQVKEVTSLIDGPFCYFYE